MRERMYGSCKPRAREKRERENEHAWELERKKECTKVANRESKREERGHAWGLERESCEQVQ